MEKTVSESFSSAAELRKAQREVEAFHRFRRLSQELLKVNEEICRARPAEDNLSPQKKTTAAIRQEVTREVEQLLCIIFTGHRKTGRLDLEAIENGCAFGLASGRSVRFDRSVAISSPGCRPAQRSLSLRPAGSLPGTLHGYEPAGRPPSLFIPPSLSSPPALWYQWIGKEE